MKKPFKEIKKTNIIDSSELYLNNSFLSVHRAKELYEKGIEPCDSYIFKLKKEERIFFYGQLYNADKYVQRGISKKEEKFSWTNGKVLIVKARLADYSPETKIQVVFDIISIFNSKQLVIATINNKEVYKGEIASNNNLIFKFILPEDKIVDIKLELPDACSPKSLDLSEDTRLLALAIEDIQFKTDEA
ncbi:MAG: hypothetical protein IKT97_07340 [Spirochaetia bacterium]|nr:hypothetical protein [Spirochaetia bacterium]